MSTPLLDTGRGRLVVAGLLGVSLLVMWLIDLLGGSGHASLGEEPFTVAVEDRADPGPTPDERSLSAFEDRAEPIPDVSAGVQAAPDATGPAKALAAVESVDVVPHVRRGDNLHRFYVPQEFFEDWYADASDDEIGLAKLKLEARVWKQMDAAADSWFARGMQDEDEYLDQAEIAQDPEAYMTGEPTRSYGLYMASRTDDMGGGVTRRRRANLPWEAHQALYNLQDESFWLMREWKRRSQGGR